jgi:hypothetical protein
MPRFTSVGTDSRPAGKKGKCTAYLIAVHQKGQAVRVYTVLANSAETALTEIRELATDAMEVEIVGALSHDTARRLNLKRGEMRLV